MSIETRAAEIARQYITRTVDAPVSGELMIVCSASVAGRRRRRIEVRSGDQLAGALRASSARSRSAAAAPPGPSIADLQIAPVLVVLRVAGPVIGDAGAAGEADAAVDDQRLAVRAVVDAPQVVPADRVVPRDVAAALLEDLQDLAADARRADRVEQDLDAHAALGGGRQRARELSARSHRPNRCRPRS